MKKTSPWFCALFLSLMPSWAAFSLPAAVFSSQGCNHAQKGQPFILALKRGEILPDALLKCLKNSRILAASLSGLGALEDPVIAYFNMDTKKYQERQFKGIYEIVSLVGNVSEFDKKPAIHVHVALANDNYNVRGGHFVLGKVGVVSEITITPISGEIQRKFNDNFKFNILEPKN